MSWSRRGGRASSGPGLQRPSLGKGAFDGAGVCCPEPALLVAGAHNEGKAALGGIPWPPVGGGWRQPLMLESLCQVGTNCHKLQNVLVAWGVCGWFTMPQPPWGGGKRQSFS